MKQLIIVILFFPLTGFSQTHDEVELEVLFKERTEVYFKFSVSSKTIANELSKVISIDHRTPSNVIHAYANREEFSEFLSFGIPYKLLKSAGELAKEPVMLEVGKKKSNNNWDYYPTYAAYDSIMYQFEADHPGICKIHSIGILSSGRELLIAQMGDSLGSAENEPRFLYTSSMHGDELTGYVLLLRLIDHLLSNYGNNARVTQLLDNIDIWINPLANPDGAYTNNNNTISGATRYNANFVDLNRNYPDAEDGPHPDGNPYQDETEAFMALTDTLLYNMSSNLHGGAEVANYPWDTWVQLHADDSWWQYVCEQYADTAQGQSPSGYFTDLNNGITNGNDWYEIHGGRQDYMTYFKYGREFTLELSNNKIPNANKLPDFWDYNYRSLLNYLEQSLYGLRGIVTDSITGDPLRALVYINGHDLDSSHVYSQLPVGNYHRYLDGGTYAITYSAPGYHSKTIGSIGVQQGTATIQDVQLAPYSAVGISVPVFGITILPQPADDWVLLRFEGRLQDVRTIEMYDITGKIYDVSYSVDNHQIRMHIEDLSAGIYCIKLKGDDILRFEKLVVE